MPTQPAALRWYGGKTIPEGTALTLDGETVGVVTRESPGIRSSTARELRVELDSDVAARLERGHQIGNPGPSLLVTDWVLHG